MNLSCCINLTCVRSVNKDNISQTFNTEFNNQIYNFIYDISSGRSIVIKPVWITFIFISTLFFSLGLFCKSMFDMYACWTDGVPNTTVKVPCPWYLPWYDQGISTNKGACWQRKRKVCFINVIKSILKLKHCVRMFFFVYFELIYLLPGKKTLDLE